MQFLHQSDAIHVGHVQISKDPVDVDACGDVECLDTLVDRDYVITGVSRVGNTGWHRNTLVLSSPEYGRQGRSGVI